MVHASACLLLADDCLTSNVEHNNAYNVVRAFQLLLDDGPVCACSDTSLCGEEAAYNTAGPVVTEKLPAFGSIPLPNLEGGFWAPWGRGIPPIPTDLLRPPGEGLLTAAPTATVGRCRWHSRRNSTSISVIISTNC